MAAGLAVVCRGGTFASDIFLLQVKFGIEKF
jgi:hypothetical protein